MPNSENSNSPFLYFIDLLGGQTPEMFHEPRIVVNGTVINESYLTRDPGHADNLHIFVSSAGAVSYVR